LQATANAELPTLYEHYSEGGVVSGLVPTADGFLLNGKPFRLISGAIHYFRVHPAYWRDRLRKLRAAGMNAVETYVAWNLHEPRRDEFDFGDGNNDMSIFLDLVAFIKMAQEEDLFVVFRPGPYICSEWEFGGLPSWLLRDYTMHVRTMYSKYIERADAFFEALLPLVTDLQFTSHGPIIAVQVENEYGHFGYGDLPRDTLYLEHVMNKMQQLGINQMFFTSDTPTQTYDWGSVAGALQTANFQRNAQKELDQLKKLQPNMPLMVTEFWSGWFDHWIDNRHGGLKFSDFKKSLGDILRLNASVNFYMFHGGTNFGFMNGANVLPVFPDYIPDVTSYDYDAPLSEAGDYTDKYEAICEMIPPVLSVQTRLPARPAASLKGVYPDVATASYLDLNDLIDRVPKESVVESRTVLAMEDLPINNMNGQSYGFTVYRKSVRATSSSVLQVRNHIRDMAQVLVDGQLQTPPVMGIKDLGKFGLWCNRDSSLTFGSWRPLPSDFGVGNATVMDIVVENLGRANFGQPHNFQLKKGLWEGPLLLDGQQLSDFQIVPLEFKAAWVRGLSGWKTYSSDVPVGPKAFHFKLDITTAMDTFLDMSAWGKGVVFVNGFNLGRYWSHVGPQMTLYLPAPLLNQGINEIVVYEQFTPAANLKFAVTPNLGP